MTDIETVRARISARFAPGWEPDLGVPDGWVTHLDELDLALARLNPDYQLAQVKTKFGGLRYYCEGSATQPACCAVWEVAHPLPTDEDASSAAWQAWEDASTEHAASPEHITATAQAEEIDRQMQALISAAETASYTW